MMQKLTNLFFGLLFILVAGCSKSSPSDPTAAGNVSPQITDSANYTVVGPAALEDIWPALLTYLAQNPGDEAAVDLIMASSGLQNEIVQPDATQKIEKRDTTGTTTITSSQTIFLGLPDWTITITITFGPTGPVVTIGVGGPGNFNPGKPPVLPTDPSPPNPPPPPVVAPSPPPTGGQCAPGTATINPDGGPGGCKCPSGNGPFGAVWVTPSGQSSCGNSPYNSCYGVPGLVVSQCIACVNKLCPYKNGFPSTCAAAASQCNVVSSGKLPPPPAAH